MNIKLPGQVQPVIVQDGFQRLRLLLYDGAIDMRHLYRYRPLLTPTFTPEMRNYRRLGRWPTSIRI
ncbi:MAG: hypothetical protein AAFS10_17135 [Myxococcota bacterium]